MHQDRRRLAQTCPKFDHPLEQACISNKNEKRNCQNQLSYTCRTSFFMVHNSAYSALHTLHKSLLQWVVKIGARLCQSSAIYILGAYPFPYWRISPDVGALLSLLVDASLLQWVVKIGARLCQSSAIVVHSWGISFSIFAHFTQCWGSLEPSRGGMLEVIGAVGSRSGLC